MATEYAPSSPIQVKCEPDLPSMDDSQNSSFEEKMSSTSEGKRGKPLKCKRCPFLCHNKEEFWDHIRTHIPASKLLTCPSCNFVTEFKHHLEFHLNNHAGIKPFACDQCSYKCNNKSMLSSHKKSHSSIYQYRCMDCTYASKYCHQLKQHLKRYMHNPAKVLNPDGSENPLQLIDVYGTKRGPKSKPLDQLPLQQQPPQNHQAPQPILPFNFPVSPLFIPAMQQYLLTMQQIQLGLKAIQSNQTPLNLFPPQQVFESPTPVIVNPDEALDLSQKSDRRRDTDSEDNDSVLSSDQDDANNNNNNVKKSMRTLLR